jgi:uncharacterized tellurite resistance protein B-like protein
MFDYLKKVLSPVFDENNRSHSSYSSQQKKIQIATCALFIEIASADDNFTADERNEIISTMRAKFNLNDEEANELLNLSEERVKNSVSVYEFTSLIDQNFSRDEKYELLKNLWRLIFVDKKLDAYEENLIRKIRLTLNMEHQDLIAAKMEVKEELNLQ